MYSEIMYQGRLRKWRGFKNMKKQQKEMLFQRKEKGDTTINPKFDRKHRKHDPKGGELHRHHAYGVSSLRWPSC